MFDEAKIRIARQVFDVGHVAGDQVIQADDPMALGQKVIAEMGTQESCAAGDDGHDFR